MAFFKFRAQAPHGNDARGAVAAAPAESVESMRRRARHRLLGAAVLVLAGVIGFPLLFDTQPRPVAVDIPIEIPDRNKTQALAVPSAPPPASNVASSKPPAPAPASNVASNTAPGMITERADGSPVVAAAPPAPPKPEAKPPEPKPEPKPETKPEPKPEAKPEPKPEHKPDPKPEAKPKPEPKPEPKPAARDDGSRALALLEGKPSSAAAAKPAAAPKPADGAGSYIIQVGAYSDGDKAVEVRQKLEKAGLRASTSVVKTSAGNRTRVRVGPFASRAEADQAAARVKGLALPAAVFAP